MSGRLLPSKNESSDDDDFDDDELEAATASASASRLGSLFADKSSNVSNGNSSLTYKAPKPPAVVAKEEPVSNVTLVATKSDDDPVAIKVLYAVPAHVFFLQNGQYVPQGKLGLAILGNKAAKEYKILIYLHNKQPVTQASLKFDSTLIVQSNNYVQFLDDRQQFWSVAFDAEVHLLDFLKWYLASKAITFGDKHKQILSIDVGDGEGGKVDAGDSLEIDYTEYLIEEGPQLTEFNGSNANRPLRIKIGKGKVPRGWEEGLVGMKKGGKRLFVIPPDVGYSGRTSIACFPTNVPLMVYVIVKRVKFSSKGDEKHKLSSGESLVKSIKETSPAIEPDVSRESSNSVEESVASDNKPSATSEHVLPEDEIRKADLVSRMAKIGQPLMPNLMVDESHKNASTPPEVFSQSVISESSEAPGSSKPIVPPRQSHELAVVCADLTLARPTITHSIAGVSKSMSDGKIGQRIAQEFDKFNLPATSVDGPPQQHFPPYLYPYALPFNPYQFFMPPNSTAASVGGSPFTGTSDFGASSASSLERQNLVIVEEIQKSHAQLQDALAKTITDTMNDFVRKVIDINGNLDVKLTSLLNSATEIPSENLVSKLSNLETLVKGIGDKRAEDPDNETNLIVTDEKMRGFVDQLNSLQQSINGLTNTLKAGGGENLQTQPSLIEQLSNIGDKLNVLETLNEKLNIVHSELKSNKEWHSKYTQLKAQALAIKEKYEERVNLLTEHLHRLQKQVELYKTEKNATPSSTDEERKVKKIMNSFYKNVSADFDDTERYSGEEIRKRILEKVKECTLSELKSQPVKLPLLPTASELNDSNNLQQTEALESYEQQIGTTDRSVHVSLAAGEVDEQEFYDAATGTPPRKMEAVTVEQFVDKKLESITVDSELANSSVQHDSSAVQDLLTKTEFVLPLLDSEPPPLPSHDEGT